MARKRARNTDNMNSEAADTHNAHRTETTHDHGREEPQRTRIPVTEAKNLDNVEHLIPEGYVGRWVLTNEIDMYKQGGYDHVEGNVSRPSGPDRTHLMIIREEWHKEDLAIEHDRAKKAMGESMELGANEYTDNLTGKPVEGYTSDNPFE